MEGMKYSFPIAPTGQLPDDEKRRPRAFYNFRKRGVTGFDDRVDSQGFYLASIGWGIVIIILDSLLLWVATRHAPATGLGPSITGNENQWMIALSATMIGLTVFGLFFQGVNIIWYHFGRWPLTAFVWFTQFLGFGLASAMLGGYLYYPFEDTNQRNEKLGIAVSDLVARAIFISVQLGLAVEYLVRAVPDPDPGP